MWHCLRRVENKDFLERAEKQFQYCLVTMKTKGLEYMAGDNDRFSNFKRIARKYGVPTELVCAIYMEKHLDSITNFIKQRCKGGKVKDIIATEPISGRIGDAINYLALIDGIIEEAGGEEQ